MVKFAYITKQIDDQMQKKFKELMPNATFDSFYDQGTDTIYLKLHQRTTQALFHELIHCLIYKLPISLILFDFLWDYFTHKIRQPTKISFREIIKLYE